MKPMLVMVYMQGCGACEEVKPHFQTFARKYPTQFQFGMMDIDKAKLNFPVEYTPTIVLKMPKGLYKTDPVALKKDLTATTLEGWVSDAVRDYKARGN
jgi:thiol-disulfide isomerase/thioredoxin